MMADTVFERVTGRSTADPATLELQLVMTDRTLLQGENEPAWLAGYGIVPAQYARDLIRLPQDPRERANADAVPGGNQAGQSPPGHNPPGPPGSGFGQKAPPDTGTGQKAPPAGTEPGWKKARDQARAARLRDLKVGGVADVWIRRLFTAPGTGQLLGMDSKARKFPDGIRRMVMARDAFCAGLWCDAPIRHIDHIVAYADGGPTTLANGQGLCERCNQSKEADGWSAKPVDGPRHSVETTTPTGHTYTSTAPPLPGTTVTGTEAAEAATATHTGVLGSRHIAGDAVQSGKRLLRRKRRARLLSGRTRQSRSASRS
jgi:hypothetical protein